MVARLLEGKSLSEALDWLVRLPQVLSFEIEDKKGVAFFGSYIQSFPDYSDFEPFALEMNMVCGLTNFMQDETVMPALEAMIPQFQADTVLFGQLKKWDHWHVAAKDFISVGPALENNRLTWALSRSRCSNDWEILPMLWNGTTLLLFMSLFSCLFTKSPFVQENERA